MICALRDCGFPGYSKENQKKFGYNHLIFDKGTVFLI